MRVVAGVLLVLVLVLVSGCGGRGTTSAGSSASPSERSEAGKKYDQMVKEQEAEKAAKAEASQAAAKGDESAYLASVKRHLAGTVLEASDRATLLEIGHSTCDAFENGTTPQEILSRKTLPPRPGRAVVVDSATHLCPEQDVALPKLLPKPKPFPPGYPKVVTVSSMPEQPRSVYEGSYDKAVAVAPGVWAGLSPGATVQDAIDGGIFDGFCGSIKAYERKYTPGVEHAGSCF